MSAFAMGPNGGRVWWDTQKQKWIVRGQEREKLVGRSSFKVANYLSMHFAGRGDEYPGGAINVVKKWIDHNQKVFGREDVVLRVFGETAGWRPSGPTEGMFGSPPNDVGIHDVPSYVNLCARNDRVKQLTALHERVLDEAFKLSHETGCIWEWCIDCTLKHTDGLCTGVIDHVIRQTATLMRSLASKYRNAAVIVNARNEWNAHNQTRTTLDEVNMWARRFYRWKNPSNGQVHQGFTAPDGFEPEQWPEAFFIVDNGGFDLIHYNVGPEPDKFKAAMIHPGRKDHDNGEPWNPRDWRVFPGEMIERLRGDARGQAYGATESMYLVTKAGTEGWYRHPRGWNKNQDDQMMLVNEMMTKMHYVIVHDDIGAQSDTDWRDSNGVRWDARLAERFEGAADPGGEPPPPAIDEWLEGHLPYVRRAYLTALGRDPKKSDDRAAFAYAERIAEYFERKMAYRELWEVFQQAQESGDFTEYKRLVATYGDLPAGLSPSSLLYVLAQDDEGKQFLERS